MVMCIALSKTMGGSRDSVGMKLPSVSLFIINSSADGHLGCLHFEASVNKAAMNMNEQASPQKDKKSFGYIPKSRIAGSCGRSIFN